MFEGAAQVERRRARESFLDRVRRSLEAGAADGLQGLDELPPASEAVAAGVLADRFAREALDAGASVTRAHSLDALRSQIVGRTTAESTREMVRANTALLAELELDRALEEQGVSVHVCELGPLGPVREAHRAAAARAAVGLCEADFGIAESGTLALLHRPGQNRLVSALPPVHIAVLQVTNLVPDLPAFFERLSREGIEPGSALSFITGPSRTADIEFVLTTGVHGPGSLHVVLVETA